jgi:alpha-tubulin suppressor-like RCC1 family protein
MHKLASALAIALVLVLACTYEFDPDRVSAGGASGDAGNSGTAGSEPGAKDCSDAEDEEACPGGTCRNGACCTGCWDGLVCQTGDEAEACGRAGASCVPCEGKAPACSEERECVAERAVISVAASKTHTCASDRRNTLWCWGDNTSGVIGYVPGAVVALPEKLENGEWIEVAAGGIADTHSCAVHFGGSLWCWGDNGSGQLGLGTGATALEREPEQVSAEAWLALSAGERVTCGIRTDSTLWCWGSSELGRNAQATDTSEPTRIGGAAGYSNVSLRSSHGCAILERDLYCWGDDTHGQLGLAERPSEGFQARPALVAPAGAWRAVAVGSRHTCAARVDGSVWCWGANDFGQCGAAGASEVALRQVDGLEGVAELAAGQNHSCALTEDGKLSCWGSNDQGQLGDPLVTVSDAPVEVVGQRRFRSVAAGHLHTCAVERSGILYCWGEGGSGQLGTGDDVSRSTPTAILLR